MSAPTIPSTALAQPDLEISPAQVAINYASCLESVKIINGVKPSFMTEQAWAGTIARNKQHLTLMLTKPYWTTEDLTLLQQACV